MYDVFSGLRESLGWRKEKPLAIDDGQKGIELGDIFSGGEDGSRTSANPLHRNRPSSVPPSADARKESELKESTNVTTTVGVDDV